jgi:tetratricopeptide (TPR) repeat protein
MSRSFHSVLLGVGALALVGATSVASAQPRRRPPQPNAKFMLVEVFHESGTPEKEMGLKAADEMRKRISRVISDKEVYLIPREDMVGMLENSGFPTEVPLEPHDAKALASALRADEYITGRVAKTDTGYTVTANLVLTRDNSLVQPLGVVNAPKINDAVEALADELKIARAQLPHEQACVNAARERNWDAAAAAAREGVAAYPKAVLARTCLANVMQEQNASTEDLLRISREIVEINPRSRAGLAIKAETFRKMDQADSAIVTYSNLLAAFPNDAALQKSVIEAITALGNPRIALPIVEEAVQRNAGDADLLRLRWLLLLAVRDYAEAFQAGEELVRLDTSFADTDYFIRTAAAYAADSQPQKAAELAARGVAKFPTDPGLNRDLVVNLRASGQNQQALEVLQRAMSSGVDVEQGKLLRVLLTRDVNGDAAAWTAAQEVLASGDSSVAPLVLQIAKARFDSAAVAKSGTIFEESIPMLALADSVNKGDAKTQAKFLFGYANMAAAQYLIPPAYEARDCAAVRKGKDRLVEAQINLPAGGQFAPEQVPQLMGTVMQLDQFADQAIAAICK